MSAPDGHDPNNYNLPDLSPKPVGQKFASRLLGSAVAAAPASPGSWLGSLMARH